MDIKTKQDLIYGLQLYMRELLEQDRKNKELKDKKSYNAIEAGIKTQYNHARCIEQKLSREIEDEIFSF